MDLVDLKLEGLYEYDPETKSLRGNPQIGYYRQPTANEYPLDLKRGYAQYIHRNGNFPHAYGVVQHHVMHLREPRHMLEHTDFVLNRGTMLKFMGDRTYPGETSFAACRFKGCIYVRSLREDVDDESRRGVHKTYPFKARQYVFTRSPGEPPNIDVPFDERKQVYGMFSAKLGNFRLIYSAEVIGVSNEEPLGDLNDPEELKKCRLAAVKLEPHRRRNSAKPLWLMQAYVSGVDELAIGTRNESGLVCQPIEVLSCAQLMRESHFNKHNRLESLHNVLEKISNKMGYEDNPNMELKFSIHGPISFDDHLEPMEPPGAFDKQFIDFTNQLYSPK